MIIRGSGGGKSTVDDEANVGLGPSEDFPDIMRIYHFRRTIGRDGPLEQVVKWIESSGTSCVTVSGNFQGNHQHLRRGLLDMSRDTVGELVIVDDGNVGLDGDTVESSESTEDRDKRVGLEDIIRFCGHHDGRGTFGQLDQPQSVHRNGAERRESSHGRLFIGAEVRGG